MDRCTKFTWVWGDKQQVDVNPQANYTRDRSRQERAYTPHALLAQIVLWVQAQQPLKSRCFGKEELQPLPRKMHHISRTVITLSAASRFNELRSAHSSPTSSPHIPKALRLWKTSGV
ncbi:hypothetical protein TGRUB_310455 [Toxoplasma gondii RUB]|uniref:Uncharacterized protein n=1 Tax=Toxoplasma gondii RUB TaxID=935652 RepID=A0A086MA96_TOXGO|nr:hypothetical protein TGRUB_310455 [Toxoplasma gondii RUB]